MTTVQISLLWFLECTAALRWQIATVSDRVLQKLRYSRLPIKKVPVHSNIGTSESRSWKLSFVALSTNEGCATLTWCDCISEYQWWTVLPRSGHSADVAGVPRWHRTEDCYKSQADPLKRPCQRLGSIRCQWTPDSPQLPPHDLHGELTVEMNTEIGHRGGK